MKQPAKTPIRVSPGSKPLVDDGDPYRFPLRTRQLATVVRGALREDRAFDDLTTIATIATNRRARGMIVAREDGVICGVPLALSAFRMLDANIVARVDAPDGTHVEQGTPVIFISGHARALLSAERVALNFMQRLSGIATLTSKYVHAIRGTRARIFDTRKTTPGWRLLEKYAVRCGGGMNHRLDLSDAILIKDNHLSALDGNIATAVRRVRKLAPPGARVEVECDRLDQVKEALEAGADAVLLDNMTVEDITAAVALANGRAITEASGGITIPAVRKIAATGVEWISIGALTHSAVSLDVALDFESLR